MALLKKVRSATLIEALVATVLIVIIFIVASLVINNLLMNSFTRNTHAIDTRINELEYQLRFKSITLPYREEFGTWDIELTQETKNNVVWLKSNATNKTNKKMVIRTKLYEAN